MISSLRSRKFTSQCEFRLGKPHERCFAEAAQPRRRTFVPRACFAVLIAWLCAVTTGSVRVTAQDVGTEAQREAGKALYLKNCSQCHGEKGDGEGYATPHLSPQPRNFTTGKFKVRTTPN